MMPMWFVSRKLWKRSSANKMQVSNCDKVTASICYHDLLERTGLRSGLDINSVNMVLKLKSDSILPAVYILQLRSEVKMNTDTH